MANRRQSIYEIRIKRSLDLLLGVLALLICLPLMLLVATAVATKLGRPILFADRRAGLGGKPFWCWKFRTMSDQRDAGGNLLPSEQRRTRFGDWLRGISLDELPQLWNIICGEMSFVGPRPLSVDYLSRYTSEQSQRHEVRPGLTGWAQVHGRKAISWERKFELDCWYVHNMSWHLDLKIVVFTGLHLIGIGGGRSQSLHDSEFLPAKSSHA